MGFSLPIPRIHINGVSCSAVDRLEAELMSELENGRLVRLLTKMGFINERPECGLHSHLCQFARPILTKSTSLP